MAKRHAKPTRATMQGGDHRQVHADAGLGGGPGLQELRRAHRASGYRFDERRRARSASAGSAGASCEHDHRAPGSGPGSKERYRRRDPGPPEGRARARQRHGGAAAREDRHQHGRRPGHPAGLAHRGGPARPRDHHRPEAGRHPGQEVDRRLQAPRGHAPSGSRSRCGATGPGSSSTGCISLAIPRIRDFRGLSPTVVRRPGQLHLRGHRAADLPRDRLRQDRHGPGHGHHDRHHRPQRRGRPGASSTAFGFPFRQETR